MQEHGLAWIKIALIGLPVISKGVVLRVTPLMFKRPLHLNQCGGLFLCPCKPESPIRGVEEDFHGDGCVDVKGGCDAVVADEGHVLVHE